MERETILWNKNEVGPQGHITGERLTPQVSTSHPKQSTALTAALDGTTVQIHSAPNGAPNK